MQQDNSNIAHGDTGGVHANTPGGQAAATSNAAASVEQPGKKRSRWELEDDDLPAVLPSPSASFSSSGSRVVSAAAVGDASASSSSLQHAVSHLDDTNSNVIFFATDLDDEYDPFKPNDYESVVKERKWREEQEEIQRQREREEEEEAERRAIAEADALADRQLQSSAVGGASGWTICAAIGIGGLGSNAGAASSSSSMSAAVGAGMAGMSARGVDNRPAWMRAAAASGAGAADGASSAASGSAPQPSPPSAAAAPVPTSDGMSKAARMMQKWGYQAGSGLGKDHTGITAPLIHEKTGLRSGIIRQADLPEALQQPRTGTSAPTLKSTVVVLRNMVAPSDVDDDLENEVAEECSAKFGEVTSVLVYVCERVASAAPSATATLQSIARGQHAAPSKPSNAISWVPVPQEEAVRIFVAFKQPEAAAAARNGMQGRYFGGRAVRASLFDEQRFSKLDLAPSAEEVALGAKAV